MDYNFQFRDKISVAVLGADTGEGQRLLALLAKHPWFQVVDDKDDVYLFFSTLEELPTVAAAVPVLTMKSGQGYCILPEVNGNILKDLGAGPHSLIVSHPSGITSALALALKPLDMAFGLEHVDTSIILPIGSRTVPSLDLLDSVMPVADGLEVSLQDELRNLLGRPKLIVGAQSIRAPMTAGLFQYVTVKFAEKPTPEGILECWKDYRGNLADLELPLAPVAPLQVYLEPGYPQPRLHKDVAKGMSVGVGSLEPANGADFRFAIVSDPEMRGPVGGALLNAELLVKRGLVFW